MFNKKVLSRIWVVALVATTLFACKKETNVSSITNNETINIEVSQNLRDLYNEKALTDIKSVVNIRQLGGYETLDGKKVKNDLLIRCAKLSKLTDDDKDILKNKYNLKEVVDFRDKDEIDIAPDKDIDYVNYYHIPITRADLSFEDLTMICDDMEINAVAYLCKHNNNLNDMYEGIVKHDWAQKGYRKFFDILLNTDGATIWHCSSGKDRTGFAAVYILSALGVDEKTILDDYEASLVAYKDRMIEAYGILKNVNYPDNDIQDVVDLIGVRRTAMEKALRIIDNEYGGMNNYLHNQIGLTDDDIEALKNKYLE